MLHEEIAVAGEEKWRFIDLSLERIDVRPAGVDEFVRLEEVRHYSVTIKLVDWDTDLFAQD